MGSRRSNSGEPSAKPRTGSVNDIAATAPAPWATPVIRRRRVTVSPSKAPGMFRSTVYLDFGVLRAEAMFGAGTILARRRPQAPDAHPRAPTRGVSLGPYAP